MICKCKKEMELQPMMDWTNNDYYLCRHCGNSAFIDRVTKVIDWKDERPRKETIAVVTNILNR